MWNVHIWDVHTGIVTAAAAATMHANNIMCTCNCSGQKKLYANPPARASKFIDTDGQANQRLRKAGKLR